MYTESDFGFDLLLLAFFIGWCVYVGPIIWRALPSRWERNGPDIKFLFMFFLFIPGTLGLFYGLIFIFSQFGNQTVGITLSVVTMLGILYWAMNRSDRESNISTNNLESEKPQTQTTTLESQMVTDQEKVDAENQFEEWEARVFRTLLFVFDIDMSKYLNTETSYGSEKITLDSRLNNEMKELYNDGKSSLSASIAIVDYLFHYYGDPWIPWSSLYDEFGLPKIIKTYEKCIEVILFDSLDDSKINPELEDGFLEHAGKVIKLYKIAVVEDVYDKTKSQRLVEEIFEYHRWILNAAEKGLTRTPFQERQDIDPFKNLYKTLGSLEDYFRQLEDLKDPAYVTALRNLLLLEGTLGLDLQKTVLQQINLSDYAEKLFQQPSLKLVLPDVI